MAAPPRLVGAKLLRVGGGRGRAERNGVAAAAAAASAGAAGGGRKQQRNGGELGFPVDSPHRRRRRRTLPLFLPALLVVVLLLFMAGGRPTAAEDAHGPITPNVGKFSIEEKDEAVAVAGEQHAGVSPDGLYFFVSSKGPRRCLVVEGRGFVHVHFKFPDAKEGKKINLELRPFYDNRPPKSRFMPPEMTRVIEAEEGSQQFKIRAKKDVPYSLCAVPPPHTDGPGLKLYLEIDTGKQDRAFDHAKKEFKLEDVQVSMIKLRDSARNMLRWADYAKELETEYHKLLLRLNREVLWWPISQVVILVVMGFYQVRHLKKFFKSKRLV